MKKIVYIAHPIAGDSFNNFLKIVDIIRKISLTRPDVLPFAPYMSNGLDDSVPEERALGIENNIELFNRKFIDEVWLFGGRISHGMAEEIALAKKLNIPVYDHLNGAF